MPAVGPSLPPHLAKRKRSIDDSEHPNSPPYKVQAATAPRILGPAPPPSKNPDELDVEDSSSDDGYGPSKSTSTPTRRAAGPTLPPSAVNPDEVNLDGESSDDEYGPAGPKSSTPPPPKRVLGPARPPASLSEMPSHPANDSSSDSDDDYGPALPPAPGSAAEARLLQRTQAENQARLAAAAAGTEPSKPQRAEWMLAPPSDSDWTSRVDPTKLKNRKFASGKGAKAPAEKSGVSAIWTETPEEKRKRLEDQVLGRVDASASSAAGPARPTAEDKEAVETARRIRVYNERNRSKTLVEEHKKGVQKEKEDDPSARGFDREKDMALGGRIGHLQQREMLAKAADFGSRFQKGKYL